MQAQPGQERGSEEMSSPTVEVLDHTRRQLFKHAMRGEWQEVVEIYKTDPRAYHVRVTKSGDSALHIAVSDGQEDIVEELVRIMYTDDPWQATKALWLANEKEKNTPLHVAASLGSVRMCHCIAQVDSSLVGARNSDNETPLFLAAAHGKKEAFLCLHHSCRPNQRRQYCVGNEGHTILHVAIAGEYFDLVLQIIHLYEELVNYVNARGITPLHILASKPTNFKSDSQLKGYSKIIYYCTFVDELKVEDPSIPHSFCADAYKETAESPYPKNYETCMHLFGLVRKAIKVVIKPTERCPGDAENQQGTQHAGIRLLPSSYNTCFEFLKFVSKAMMVILGSGYIKKIREKKEKHVWSVLIMKELLERTVMYAYEDSGRSPHREMVDYDIEDEVTEGSETHETGEQVTARLMMVKKGAMDKPKIPEMPVVESPILMAAKNGITEMVEKILERFPVAIHDKNTERKNVVLLAAEHRQPHVYQLLLKITGGKDSDNTTVKDVVFRQVDNKGNSALHLAATLGDYKPWLIPEAALQMQWEMKWYELVKNSVPRQFFIRQNKAGKTPKDIFTETHKELVQNGSQWLTNTSESCSVVAALIATVAFATSAVIPGGLKQDIGTPILEHQPAFSVFAFSSLVALCFSLISLIMFLAILTSPYQEKHFGRDLPRKLFLGLTLLFVSIAAMLVSFCAGHFFLLKDKLRDAAFPIYTVTCLVVTLFAIAQFPLYFDLVRATFKKVPQRSYSVVPP